LGNYQTILGANNVGGPELSLDSTGHLVFNSQFNAAIGTSASSISSGAWTYVAVTYGSGTYTFYINGVTNAGDSGTSSVTFSTQSPSIGRNGSAGNSYCFNGSIADFEGFKHVCSQDEINALYNRIVVP